MTLEEPDRIHGVHVEFLAIIFIIAAVVWTAALLRGLSFAGIGKVNIIPLLTMCVVVLGAVAGPDLFSVDIGPLKISLDRLVLFAVLALCGWLYVTNREDLRPLNRLDVAVFAVILLLIASTAAHDFAFKKHMPVARLLFFYLLPFAVYMVARTAKTTEMNLKLCQFAFVLLAVYLAVTAICEVKGLHGFVFPRYIIESETTEFLGRGRGPFLNPVSNGMFLLIGLCCLWFWWPAAKRTRYKVVIMVLSVLICGGIYATLTRSVWMSLIAAAFLLIFLPARQHQKGAMIVVGAVLMIALAPKLLPKLTSFKRDKNVSVAHMQESAQLRPLFFTVAWRMFQDRPLLGCGFGQYPREKNPYLQDAYTGKPLEKTAVYTQHNVFLAYLTETGLLGMGCLIAMMALMTRVAWRVWDRPEGSLISRQFGMLLGAMLLAYAGNGMFHDVSLIPMGNMLLFFLAGVANNIFSHQRGHLRITPKRQRRETTTVPSSPFEAHTVPAASS